MTDGDVPSGATTEETREYVTDRLDLSPRIRYQWAGRAVILAIVLGVAVAFAAGSLDLLEPLYLGVGTTVLAAVLGLLHVVFRYRIWVYQLRTDALYLERGVLTHVRTIVPYVRIQHVDTQRGPVERALGLSTLVVYTAGSRGADVAIPGLTPDQASHLQGRVKELAIEAEGGDAV